MLHLSILFPPPSFLCRTSSIHLTRPPCSSLSLPLPLSLVLVSPGSGSMRLRPPPLCWALRLVGSVLSGRGRWACDSGGGVGGTGGGVLLVPIQKCVRRDMHGLLLEAGMAPLMGSAAVSATWGYGQRGRCRAELQPGKRNVLWVPSVLSTAVDLQDLIPIVVSTLQNFSTLYLFIWFLSILFSSVFFCYLSIYLSICLSVYLHIKLSVYQCLFMYKLTLWGTAVKWNQYKQHTINHSK